MFIAQVTFSTKDFEVRSILDNKASHAKEDFEGFQGFRGAEVWKSESKSKLEYAIVSRWDDKKDFQAWVSRPDHVEEHKSMNKETEEQEKAKYQKIEKQIKKYEIVE